MRLPDHKAMPWVLILVLFVAGLVTGYANRPRLLPQYRQIIQQEAGNFALDARLIEAVVMTESSGLAYALSHRGAVGLMQIMPATARQLAEELKFSTLAEANLLQPEINIRLGCYYFYALLRRFHGDLILTLAAYNTGPTRVSRWMAEYPLLAASDLISQQASKETRLFVRQVMQRYERGTYSR